MTDPKQLDQELPLDTPAKDIPLNAVQADMLSTLQKKQREYGFEVKGKSGRKMWKPFEMTLDQLRTAINDFRRDFSPTKKTENNEIVAVDSAPLTLSDDALSANVLLLTGADRGVQLLKTPTQIAYENDEENNMRKVQTTIFRFRIVAQKNNRYQDMLDKNGDIGKKRRSLFATDAQWAAIKKLMAEWKD